MRIAAVLALLAAAASPALSHAKSSPDVSNATTIMSKIVHEKRRVVYSSRRLTGECLPICVEEPEVLNLDPPTVSPTAAPTKNPTAAPTEDVVQNAPPYTGSCPAFTESFDGQVCDEFMEESALWFTSGVNVKAIGDFTPNANGVHIPEGGYPLVECAGNDHQLTVDGSGPSTLVFTFNEPTYVNSMDTTNCDDLTVYYSTGGSDNIDLSESSSVLAADVESMEVGCNNGGAVKEIDYMFCPPDEGCPLKVLDFSEEVVKGQWVHDEFKDTHYVTISAKKIHTSSSHAAFTPIKSGDNYVDAGCASGSCSDWNEGYPRVFDTAEPTCYYNNGWRGGDTDLGAPNIEFGGDGRGCGGGKYYMRKKSNNVVFEGETELTIYNRQKSWNPPARDNCMFVTSFHGDPAVSTGDRVLNPWVNDKEQGKVLIISEHNPGNNPTGPFTSGSKCPDDTGKGGFIIFRFEKPVSLQSLELLDTDEGKTPEAYIKYCDGTTNAPGWDSDGVPPKSLNEPNPAVPAPYKTPKTGDNGFAHVDIQDENVCELWMKYYGSGSFSKLKYGVCPTD